MKHRLALTFVAGLLVLPAVGRGEEGDFKSKDVKIHYLIEGKGEPVLLIHGFAVNIEGQWGAPGIIKALAKDYRVIAFDNRGHGKSDKPTDDKKYGLEMVEDAVRLLDHLKIKKAHVVGYSMGALIAGKLAVTHPDRVLTLTLGGGGVIPEGVKLPPFIAELAVSLEKGEGMGPLVIALTPPGMPKPPEAVINQINRRLVGDNGKVLAAVVRSWKTLTVSKKQLEDNKIPTLALVGSNDPLKDSLKYIKDDMAHLQIVTIDGTDHVSTFLSPQFVRHLRTFLAKHPQKEKRPAAVGK